MNPLRGENPGPAAQARSRREGVIQLAAVAPSHEFAVLHCDMWRLGRAAALAAICRIVRERDREATEPPMSPKDPMQ